MAVRHFTSSEKMIIITFNEDTLTKVMEKIQCHHQMHIIMHLLSICLSFTHTHTLSLSLSLSLSPPPPLSLSLGGDCCREGKSDSFFSRRQRKGSKSHFTLLAGSGSWKVWTFTCIGQSFAWQNDLFKWLDISGWWVVGMMVLTICIWQFSIWDFRVKFPPIIHNSYKHNNTDAIHFRKKEDLVYELLLGSEVIYACMCAYMYGSDMLM